ncbi:MAG: o-succinylbenzoate synthase [Bacteroidetes bacterium]|nr:o-succinylbenzoate synthase [Bacteroidota bacterium]
MKGRIVPYRLKFKKPAGTSRGTLTEKPSYFIILEADGKLGIGECGVFPGLSLEWNNQYEETLFRSLEAWKSGTLDLQTLRTYPSMLMGWETAIRSMEEGDTFFIFNSSFQHGVPIYINGLIWMGDVDDMAQQIEARLDQGFNCIKLKIGALDWSSELNLLKAIRARFSAQEIELRVDANGAFRPEEALAKLEALAELEVHSIEQPIKAGQWDAMAGLCAESPLDIALDEELIGIDSVVKKEELLDTIQPKYLILKPSLVGGFQGSDEWIRLADERDVHWWATSALESNIGLNAIAQWVSSKQPTLPQGLGTGSLYVNNIPSPLEVSAGTLKSDLDRTWDIKELLKIMPL